MLRILCWGLGIGLATMAGGSEPITLAPNDSIELRAGSGHVTALVLLPSEASSRMRLRVEQRGTDVLVRLLGFHIGERFADQPLGFHEPELMLVDNGAYGLQLISRTTGPFRVFWQPAGDEPRSAGDIAWTEGTHLYHRQASGDRERALDAFSRAAQAYEQAELWTDAARAWTVAGHVASELGEAERGQELIQRVVELRSEEGSSVGLAEAWHLLGNIRRRQGDAAGAREAFERSLHLSRELGDARGEGRALLNLGFLDHRAGLADLAETRYEAALARVEGLGDASLEAKLLNNLGGLAFEAGRALEALGRFEALLPLQRTLEVPRATARTWMNMAAMHRVLGRYQQSLDAYQKALEELASADETRLRGWILNNLGYAYLRLGEVDKARDHFLQALDLRRRVGDLRGEVITLNNLGLAAMEQEQWQRSAEAFDRALHLSRHSQDRRREAMVLHNRGRLEMAQGRFGEAERLFEQAMELLHRLGDPRGKARVVRHWLEGRLGAADGETGGKTEALAAALGPVTSAIDDLRRFGDRDGEAEALWARARAHRRLGNTEAALADLRQAIEAAESLRLELRSPDLRSTLMGVKRSIFEESVDLLMDRAMDAGMDRELLEQGFSAAEQARARGLLDVLSGAGSPGLPSDARASYRRLVERLAVVEHQLGLRRGKGQLDNPQLEVERRRLSIELDRHLQDAVAPERRDLTASAPVGLGELQRLLALDAAVGDETLVVAFSLGSRRSWAWLVAQDRVDAWPLPPRDEIDRRVREVYGDLAAFDPRNTRPALERARSLSTLLLGSRLDELPVPRLTVVPEGSLLSLPFGALPVPGGAPRERLIDRFEIAYLPSTSLLPVLQGLAERAPAERLMAIVADPVGEPGAESSPLPGPAPLPHSRREAERLAELAGEQTLMLLGPEARKEAVLGRGLKGYRWLHFATHGYVDDERPELSSLALSQPTGATGDGRLRLHDIYGMTLDADLVVLSGCETGLGKSVRGEGYLGLTRGFFFAGAARVAAGLWRVEDRATAELMTRFYGNMLEHGQAPTQALRQAQLALRRETRYKDPFYWAGFVVQGDWRIR